MRSPAFEVRSVAPVMVLPSIASAVIFTAVIAPASILSAVIALAAILPAVTARASSFGVVIAPSAMTADTTRRCALASSHTTVYPAPVVGGAGAGAVVIAV